MEVPDSLLCLFSARVEEEDDAYVIEVPAREITEGQVQSGETYRAALLPTDTEANGEVTKPEERTTKQSHADTGPPVEVGEQRTVDIEDIGDQGDGIARVERGYVIIVPDTETNERVRIEISDVSETVGFGEVVERQDYYE